MASNIPIIEDAGSMKNGVWIPNWKSMASQAKKLGAKTVKTKSGKVIYFDNNYNPTSVDENPQMKGGGKVASNKTVTCSNCGWSWNKSDSSNKDMYVCHQCGRDNSNKSESWLDKYEQGGMVLEQKTEDNYGKKPNLNDIEATMPPGFVGMGNDTTGRDYSPAWGGQFQGGGSLPGSVGFTYARTAGSAPANGKYTKKTLASAQNGQEMSYYQHGLDFKTKGMKNGGWLDAYDVPQAQEGNVFAKREPLRPASESTSIMRNIPGEGPSTTATTGQRKEDVRLDTEGMARFKAAETKDKQERIAERKSAISAKDKGKPFTLPTGESKKYEDMDWREKAYVSGKSLESKGRFNENDEAWYDDYINPVSWVTDIAGGLATAPLEAREYDSNLPYVGAALNPLVMGRIMGSGSINPLSKKFWTNEVSNKEFINNMALGVPEMAKGLANKVGQSMESGILSKAYKANSLAIKEQGGVVKDDMGYWNPDNHGKVVEIDSPYITMEGVDQPLIGISDEGDKKYMLPGKNYKFKGKKVREYPVAKNGLRQEQKGLQNLDQLTNFTNYNKPQPGGWLNKYN